MPEQYLIQAPGIAGNSLLWWREGDAEYTTNIDDATRYTREEAESRAAGQPDAKLWSIGSAYDVSTRHVNIEHVKRS